MPSRKRTTTAATAKNRSRNKSGSRVGCPCKECGFDELLTKAKMRWKGRKQDGGRVYLGMIDDESYYSPPVVAAAAAAAPPYIPGPGPGPFPLTIPTVYTPTANFPTFPTYPELAGAGSAAATDLRTLITNGGGTPAMGPRTLRTNQNILRRMYYPTDPPI